MAVVVGQVQAAGSLPVPCGGGACGTNATPTPFVNPGGSVDAPVVNGTQMTITQHSAKAITNFASFNIDRGYSVQVNQLQGSTSSMMARIWDANPTTIQGSLSANGQLFLLNQNGIIFANGAQVDVHSLVASSLNVSDGVFTNGLVASAGPIAQFQPFSPSSPHGFVQVANGATIRTSNGGSVMLFAPTVENNGVVVSPDGQILLAAGSKVYLAPSGDSGLRGLLVAVDNSDVGDANTDNAALLAQQPGDAHAKIGAASNLDLGKLIADRGNVTIAGLAVNQMGRVSATTSVNANGSIYLVAGDTPLYQTGSTNPYVLQRSGTLTFGAGSVTEVLPDATDSGTVVDTAQMNPSRVSALGQHIVLQGDALVHATGGKVNLSARVLSASNRADYTSTDLPQTLKADQQSTAADASIDMAAGSRIDVAGASSAVVPAESDILSVQLRGSELQDSPLQRNGFLHGQTVYMDVHDLDANGNIPLANLAPYLNQIGRTVGERLAAGGSVGLQSEGSVVVHEGAHVDVSGGVVNHAGGLVHQNTQLVTDTGQVFDISRAPADRTYMEISSPAFRYAPGYVEGKGAGTVAITAHNVSLPAHSLSGNAVAGPYQRLPALRPSGGTLLLGDASYESVMSNADYKLPGIAFYSGDAPPAADGRVWIASNLVSDGFSRIIAYTNGRLSVPGDVSLTTAPGGLVRLRATGAIDVAGSLSAPGGTLDLQTITALSGAATGSLTLAPGASLSTAGLWVNDALGNADLSLPVQSDGGSITLKAYGNMSLAPGGVIDASSGAWLAGNGALQKGNGGSITLAVQGPPSTGDRAGNLLDLGAELRAYGVGAGGTLSVQASKIFITDGAALPAGWGNETLVLGPRFFTQGGFQQYTIRGYDALTVADGTVVRPDYATWLLGNAYAAQASGTPLRAFATASVLPWQTRGAMTLNLDSPNNYQDGSGQFGLLTLGSGSLIDLGPLGRMNLSAGNQLWALGTILAPGGTIGLNLAAADTSHGRYWDNRSIWVGDTAMLDASGTLRLLPNNMGLRQGDVLPGGAITFAAAGGGNIVVQARRDGLPTLDVSGTHAVLDLPQQVGDRVVTIPRDVASDAGSITLTATEGIFVDDGALHGEAGGVGANGGRFAATILKEPNRDNTYPMPYADRRMILSQSGSMVPAGLRPGASIDPARYDGQARLAVAGLQSGGFDSVTFKSENQIEFNGPISLQLGRSLMLDASAFAGGTGSVDLRAPYVRMGNLEGRFQGNLPTASGGAAQLRVNADVIDLEGNAALQGFQSASYTASGDVRFVSVFNLGDNSFTGRLAAGGDLLFSSAQAYPTTLSDFRIDTPGAVRFQANGNATPVPLSAGGSLTVNATNIYQDGVLRAPLGSLALNAGGAIEFGSTSLTSVSADGALIPFGQTSNGLDWTYTLASTYSRVLSAPPAKRISINAPGVNVSAGARVDLSGGGDLYAYEFVSGPGGSRDILAQAGTYAVLPGFTGYAPRDAQNELGSTLQAGDRIYLAGGAGLPAGYYTLLPAHYALLPGAYVVRSAAGHQDMTAAQRQTYADGSAMVAGYHLAAGSNGGASRSEGLVVMSGELARQYSGFDEHTANSFLAAAAQANTSTPPLPKDAGRLVINANQLQLNALPLFAPAAGGQGGEFDLVSARIQIVDDAATQATPGYLTLGADLLNSLQVDSLLLGGTRSESGSAYDLTVGADSILVQNSAAHTLRAGEVILAATDQIVLGDGMASGRDGFISAIGAASASSRPLNLSGDGALLRVANGAQAQVLRSNVSGAGGMLQLLGAAHLDGDAVLLDATRDTTISSAAVIDAASLSVASSRVSFGNAPAQQNGLVLTAGLISQLARSQDLRLQAYGTMDFYDGGGLDLLQAYGNASSLTLDAPALVGHTAENIVVQAGTLRLVNTSTTYTGSDTGSTGTGDTGTLALRAGSGMTMGEGVKSLRGFGRYTLAAANEVVTTGVGSLDAAGDLRVETQRVVADTGSDQALSATGALVLAGGNTTSSLPPVTAVGGKLKLSGDTVDLATEIDALAGHLLVSATGGTAGTDSLVVGANAYLNASGYAKPFGAQSAAAPAGTVELTAANGDLAVQGGARIDVAAAPGGDAGSVRIQAVHGSADIAGGLAGQSDASGSGLGGSFALDAGTVSGLSGLAGALLNGGFRESVSIRVRDAGANLVLAQADTLKSRNVQLVSDQGSITVAGRIDASGPSGGNAELWAAGDVVLRGSAIVDASATAPATQYAGATGDGGRVTLATAAGSIDVQSGSRVNVTANGAYGQAGRVVLRAPRTAGGNDLAIRTLDGDFSGAGEVVAEGYQSYAKSSLGVADVATTSGMYTDAAQFANQAAAIAARLGRLADASFHVRPGIEVRSAGDLTLGSDWALNAWRFGAAAEPGVLTLRAGGNLVLNGSISDGFNSAAPTASLMAGPSWSYRLVSGADDMSADVLATANRAGNLTLAAGKLVRTGSGDIAIASGGDLTLKAGNGSLGVIYTAGTPSATTGFAAPAGSVFPAGGGNLSVAASGSIIQQLDPQNSKQQLINDWLTRKTSGGTAFWWPDFSKFRQGVGVLGGGQLRVSAQGDVVNLGAVVPVNGKTAAGVLDIRGGGDLTVIAGGDIRGGVFQVGSGTGRLIAGGSIGSGRTILGRPVNPFLALEQGHYQLTAGRDVAIASVFDPTAIYLAGGLGSSTPYFYNYASGSGIRLTSVTGDARFENQLSTAALLKSAFYPAFNDAGVAAFNTFPGTVEAAALNGDISIVNQTMTLFPDVQGNLSLLAGGDILLSGAKVYLGDYSPASIPGPLSPALAASLANMFVNWQYAPSFHANPLLHGPDAVPASLYAATGNIDLTDSSVMLMKSTIFDAGNDILFPGGQVYVQNNTVGSVSRFAADRDIYSPTVRNAANALTSNSGELDIGGIGFADVWAGRNINLGNSNGIHTVGDLKNPSLPGYGATLTVAAGLGRDASGHVGQLNDAAFAAAYLDAGSDVGGRAMADFGAQLRANIAKLPNLSDAERQARYDQAMADFAAMSLEQRVLRVFYNELRQAALEGATGRGYGRGYQAIATLFPDRDSNGDTRTYNGDILLYFSQIKTERGGNIQLLVPGGLINAGLANPPSSLSKGPGDLGIMTLAGGDVLAMSDGDIQVNQSRIFTVQGGDIVLWSTHGSIDAGKGAKSTTAAPPPQIVIDANGNLSVNVQGTVTGSGIGVLLTTPDTIPGDVVLAAPSGAVDAGDAGIRAAGNLLLAAQQVLGASNISVGGISIGVPASSGGGGATFTGTGSLSQAGQVANDAMRSLADSADTSEELKKMKEKLAKLRPSFITVEVIGLGG